MQEKMCDPSPPVHGGRLRLAAKRLGIPLSDWLDLSTGINPLGWPIPTLGGRDWASVWSRLPEEDDGLERAAADYYGTDRPLPVAGSQAAIQALPLLRGPSLVGVPAVGFREHVYAWGGAGHRIVALPDGDPTDDGLLDRLDVLVVINPNNPTGQRRSAATLLDWHGRLARRGGWLVVDEAFMDCQPGESLAPYVGAPGLLVLRSLGKFFGLAGARVGFVLTEPGLRERLQVRLGPWTLPGPSRLVAALALLDRAWQAAAQESLPVASARLAGLLTRSGLPPQGGTALFQWVPTLDAAAIYEALARQAVLVRHFEDPTSLRLGLPGDESQWARLSDALAVALAEVRA